MSNRERAWQPTDMALIQTDDLLLDALGRGEPASAGDETAELLAAWRSDLDKPAEVDLDRLTEVDLGRLTEVDLGRLTEVDLDQLAEVADRARADPARESTARESTARESTARESTARESTAGESTVVPIDRARRSRRNRLVAAVAAVTVLASGGTLVATANGTPVGPFWPPTRIVNPERADAIDAQHKIDQARDAITDGRPDDALRLLDQADEKIARVHESGTAMRLRAEATDLRRRLNTQTSNVSGGAASSQTPAPAGEASSSAVPSRSKGMPRKTAGGTESGSRGSGSGAAPGQVATKASRSRRSCPPGRFRPRPCLGLQLCPCLACRSIRSAGSPGQRKAAC